MDTKKVKKGLYYIPEILIMLVAIWWFLDGLLGASFVNYLALAIIVIIAAIIILKNKHIAVYFSAIMGLGSLYMLLAVFSEYREFPPGDAEGIQLLLIGSSIFISTLAMSIILPIKYFNKTKKSF